MITVGALRPVNCSNLHISNATSTNGFNNSCRRKDNDYEGIEGSSACLSGTEEIRGIRGGDEDVRVDAHCRAGGARAAEANHDTTAAVE